jgi:hypothetical protein
MHGDDIFKTTKETRLRETSSIQVRDKETLISNVNYLRRLKSEERKLRKSLEYSPELETVDFPPLYGMSNSPSKYKGIEKLKSLELQIKEQTQWNKQDIYQYRVNEIYEKAPQEVEAQIKELGLVRGFGNRSVLKEQLARMNRFRRSAIAAVGIGHKSARNAGKKHCNFASTGQK